MQVPDLYEESINYLLKMADIVELYDTKPRSFAMVYHALTIGVLSSCYRNNMKNCPSSYQHKSNLMWAMAQLNTSGHYYDSDVYFNVILRDSRAIESAYGVKSPFYN